MTVLRPAIISPQDWAPLPLGAMAMARGRYRDARRWLAEADGHFAEQDAFGTVFSLRALDVGVAFFTGDLPAAESSTSNHWGDGG